MKASKPEDYQSFVTALSASIRASRQRAGLSQEDVAFRSGISVRHYQKLESGETGNPKLENLCGVASALEISLSNLISRAERHQQSPPRR